jgi:hypothetical protein
MVQLTDRDHTELMTLYKITIDDIERAKQWAWKVAYTTIAAEGAALALFRTYRIDNDLCWIRLAFIILCLGLCALGVNYISHAYSSLEEFRDRKVRIQDQFSEKLNIVFGEPTQKKEWPLYWVVIGGTAIVLLALLFF